MLNRLLLVPHLDLAFDQGFITLAHDGALVVSDALDAEARAVLGLEAPLRLHGLSDGLRRHLSWHRARVFRARAP